MLKIRNGTQQDLNKMVDMVTIWGGQKDRPDAENGGKTAAHTYWLSKRECHSWWENICIVFVTAQILHEQHRRTGDDPIISELSTILLPTKMRLILELVICSGFWVAYNALCSHVNGGISTIFQRPMIVLCRAITAGMTAVRVVQRDCERVWGPQNITEIRGFLASPSGVCPIGYQYLGTHRPLFSWKSESANIRETVADLLTFSYIFLSIRTVKSLI